MTSEYCETCHANTKRCEFYPTGRSRQHGRCLECDLRDAKRPEDYHNRNRDYCFTCDQIPNDRFRQ